MTLLVSKSQHFTIYHELYEATSEQSSSPCLRHMRTCMDVCLIPLILALSKYVPSMTISVLPKPNPKSTISPCSFEVKRWTHLDNAIPRTRRKPLICWIHRNPPHPTHMSRYDPRQFPLWMIHRFDLSRLFLPHQCLRQFRAGMSSLCCESCLMPEFDQGAGVGRWSCC